MIEIKDKFQFIQIAREYKFDKLQYKDDKIYIDGIINAAFYDRQKSGSWAVEYMMYGTVIMSDYGYRQNAIIFHVEGLLYVGWVVVVYNLGKDLYEVYTFAQNGEIKQEETDLYFDMLCDCIDRMVEYKDEQTYNNAVETLYKDGIIIPGKVVKQTIPSLLKKEYLAYFVNLKKI